MASVYHRTISCAKGRVGTAKCVYCCRTTTIPSRTVIIRKRTCTNQFSHSVMLGLGGWLFLRVVVRSPFGGPPGISPRPGNNAPDAASPEGVTPLSISSVEAILVGAAQL